MLELIFIKTQHALGGGYIFSPLKTPDEVGKTSLPKSSRVSGVTEWQRA